MKAMNPDRVVCSAASLGRAVGAGLALGLVLALVSAVPAAAVNGGGGLGAAGGDGAAAGSGLQLASEAIGSLPTWWVADDWSQVAMPDAADTLCQQDAHLEAYVPEDQLDHFVVAATGTGFVFLSLPVDQPGWVRVRFFGDVLVDLDRAVVKNHALTFQIERGSANLGGLGLLTYQGAASLPFTLAPELTVPLGLSPALDNLFSQAPVSLWTASPQGDVGRIDLSAGPLKYRILQDVE
jgi:hypothetical protein